MTKTQSLRNAVLGTAVFAVVVLAGVPSPKTASERNSDLPDEVWLQIVERAEGSTPARFLLGAPGDDENLNVILITEGVSPEQFRAGATRIREQALRSLEVDENPLDEELASYLHLPEGLSLPPPSNSIATAAETIETTITEAVRRLLPSIVRNSRLEGLNP